MESDMRKFGISSSRPTPYAKQARLNRGLSRKEAAFQLGLSEASLIQIENGKKTPAVRVLVEMAKLYFCTIDELCGERKK